MRTELYGIYMTDNMCAAADGETVTARECRGDRNCSLNADCKPLTNDSIIKTSRCGDVKTFRCEKIFVRIDHSRFVSVSDQGFFLLTLIVIINLGKFSQMHVDSHVVLCKTFMFL